MMQQRGLQPLARPIGEPIDLVFRATYGGSSNYALVQVKATQQKDIKGQMKRVVPDLLQYGFNVAAANPLQRYSCYIIGVRIRPQGSFELSRLSIDLA